MKSRGTRLFGIVEREFETVEGFRPEIQICAPDVDFTLGKCKLLGRGGPDDGIGHLTRLSVVVLHSDRSIPIRLQIPYIRRYFTVNEGVVPLLPAAVCLEDLDGKETEPWEILYFKAYKSQLPVIERALETAGLMLGSDKSRGYCLEMICADFLAGVSLEAGNQDALLRSLTRLVIGLPKPQRKQFIEEVQAML